jgi:peptide/nickel transport system ATP-binding protein
MESAPVGRFFAQPAHPYTRRLLESLPAAGTDIKDIAGEIPSLIEPPSGCRFHPRCDYASAACRRERPALTTQAGGHWLRCYQPQT